MWKSRVERVPDGGIGEHVAQVSPSSLVVGHVGGRVLEVAEALPAAGKEALHCTRT